MKRRLSFVGLDVAAFALYILILHTGGEKRMKHLRGTTNRNGRDHRKNNESVVVIRVFEQQLCQVFRYAEYRKHPQNNESDKCQKM